ncbi:MAG: phosphate acyltransferase, partial [Pseudomonadota bacterium]
PIEDMEEYRHSLARRLDPTASFLQGVQSAVRRQQKRIVFAEGEEPQVVRAAWTFQQQGLGHPILIGREAQVERTMKQMGVPEGALEIVNARLSDRNADYTDYLYDRLQRRGYLKRDAQRLVNQDRNVFGSCMLAHGDADGMVTGVTRNYDVCLTDVRLSLDPLPDSDVIGMSMVINRGKTIFIADTSVNELPNGEQLAGIAKEAAMAVKRLGFIPRVAFLSYSTFGNPMGERAEKVRDAVEILDACGDCDFEYEGDIAADVALNPMHKHLYPFSRLSGEANVLVMPAIHSASISTKLLEGMSRATIIGPVLLGMSKSVQIASLGATVNDIVNLATVAAFDIDRVGS